MEKVEMWWRERKVGNWWGEENGRGWEVEGEKEVEEVGKE